jgi:hypothetical protein
VHEAGGGYREEMEGIVRRCEEDIDALVQRERAKAEQDIAGLLNERTQHFARLYGERLRRLSAAPFVPESGSTAEEEVHSEASSDWAESDRRSTSRIHPAEEGRATRTPASTPVAPFIHTPQPFVVDASTPKKRSRAKPKQQQRAVRVIIPATPAPTPTYGNKPPPMALSKAMRRGSFYARCKSHYQEGALVISDDESEIKPVMAASIPPPIPLSSLGHGSSYGRCKSHYQVPAHACLSTLPGPTDTVPPTSASPLL